MGLAGKRGLALLVAVTILGGVGVATADVGSAPATQCYGMPPHQTPDPMSPPCVPIYTGDNGGATYQGVTANRVNVLVTLDGGINYIGGSDPTNRVSPSDGRCIDLSTPPLPPLYSPEHLTTTGLRVWQTYFNRMFQTYHRTVSLTACYANGTTAESRRQDAASEVARVQPFAAIPDLLTGNVGSFLQEVADRGVIGFGAPTMARSFYAAHPGLTWGVAPSAEIIAANAGAYVCDKVVPFPSALAGPDLNHRPRKLGLIRTSDTNFPEMAALADGVVAGVNGCGGSIAATASFPTCCYASNNTEVPAYALQSMLEFKLAGITTILWPGGANGSYARAAAALGYLPEWIMVGDGTLDSNTAPNVPHNSALIDHRALVVSPQAVEPEFRQKRCYQAFRSVDSTMPDSDVAYVCEYYRNLFQLFTAIQVAGPTLTPANVDIGLHAIPADRSFDPMVPSCYYDPGDYTCVKDAQVEYWSATATPPGSQTIGQPVVALPVLPIPRTPGCWEPIEGGKRYIGDWPAGNIDAQITGYETCNNYSASVLQTGPV
jgi:hypothetical protein